MDSKQSYIHTINRFKVGRFMGLISLSTPRSRLGVWAILTTAIYIAPFAWLKHLSLYGHLGWRGSPSIGLTRAYWFTLHGQFHNAWQMNSLIFLVLLVGIPLLISDALKLKQPLTKTKVFKMHKL